MKQLQLLWNNYRYFPYEKVLAKREAESLFGRIAAEDAHGITIAGRATDSAKISLPTYFKAVVLEGRLVVPDQALLESSTGALRSPLSTDATEPPRLAKQNTRYSAHGLHEYRGKFNPQVVRAIGNILGLARDSWLLDPFCGSGTSLLEAAHVGWNAIGLDLNPLAVLIANAKVAAFRAEPAVLSGLTDRLLRHLGAHREGRDPQGVLPNLGYLTQWFAEPVLRQLAYIVATIDTVAIPELRDVFRVVLSDICRSVSLQEPADLRIRRRKAPASSYPVVDIYAAALRPRIDSILAARAHVAPRPSLQQALLADSRDAAAKLSAAGPSGLPKTFQAAITSPPYATALPYIDTQRLSLCLLGLLDQRGLKYAEKSLIGNREISSSERGAAEDALQENDAGLPSEVINYCRDLLVTATHDSHGFRRKNVPGLLYRYLADMASMFTSVHRLVRPRGYYALLVGSNSTVLRGERIAIDTPQLLCQVAAARGWSVQETIPLDTYHRYDIHSRNSITSEALLVLRRERV